MPVHFRRVPDRADDLEHTIGAFVADIEGLHEELVHVDRFGDQLALFTRRTPPLTATLHASVARPSKPAGRKAVAK